jgi:hypothetical protein
MENTQIHTLNQKFEKLLSMKEKGKISEEEFGLKKQELIDSI